MARGVAPSAAPGDHGLEQRDQFVPVWGDGVQDLHGSTRDDRAFDESLRFEILKALGEDLVGDPIDHGAVLGEPAGAARSGGQDGSGPPLADELGCVLNRSAGALVLGWCRVFRFHFPKVSGFLRVCQVVAAAESLRLTDHGGPDLILDPALRVAATAT